MASRKQEMNMKVWDGTVHAEDWYLQGLIRL